LLAPTPSDVWQSEADEQAWQPGRPENGVFFVSAGDATQQEAVARDARLETQ